MNMPLDYDTMLDLLPAYALGAVDADEARQIEAALQQSPELRAELVRLERVMNDLHQAVLPMTPPSDLRDKIIAQAVQSDNATQAVTDNNIIAPNFARRRQILVMAAILGVVLLGVFLWMQFNDETIAPPDPIATILEDEAAIHVAIMGTEGNEAIEGEFVIASNHSEAVLQLTNLNVLSSEQVYQLWLIRDNQRFNGLIFRPESSETTQLVSLPEDFVNFDAIGVTVEPDGGSPGPTSDPIFAVPLDL